MSDKHDIQQMMVSMGFHPDYIERALKVYEKKYGNNYNMEIITEIIINLQNKDNTLKTKRKKKLNAFDASIPKCPCGIYLQKIKAKSCYSGSGILCNECLAEVNGDNFVYHCAAKKITAHALGYDVCETCANRSSGWRHRPIFFWTCKELQAWVISLNIGADTEQKLVASITEQEINGSDFDSMEAVSDVMDSFELKVGPAIKVYTALKAVRNGTNTSENDTENIEINDDDCLPLLFNDQSHETKQNINTSAETATGTGIDAWDCDKLHQWILTLNIEKIHAKKVANAIVEQEITGEDFNSMTEVCEIMDSFEIEKSVADKMFNALEKLRGNIEINDDELFLDEPVETEQNKKQKSEQSSSSRIGKKKYKMKGKLAARFGHLNIDPTKLKVGAAPPKRKQKKVEQNEIQPVPTVEFDKVSAVSKAKGSRRKRTRKKVALEIEAAAVDEPAETVRVVPENNENNAAVSNISYDNKQVKCWGEYDVLEWIKTIGLKEQWLQMMSDAIKSTNCNGKQLCEAKKGKELENILHIKQPMLAGRVFRELKKAKLKYANCQLVSMDTHNQTKKIQKKTVSKQTVSKVKRSTATDDSVNNENNVSNVAVVVAVVMYTDKKVKNWNNNDLLAWIKTIGLKVQWQQIMVEIIQAKGCTGNQWFEVKNFKELATKFDIKQPMLAGRVFREFRKAKRTYVNDKNNNNDEAKQQNEQNMNRIIGTRKRQVSSIAPSKPLPPIKNKLIARKASHVWETKHINEWTCNDLNKWIASLKINKNMAKKVIQTMIEMECDGSEFNSIEDARDIMDSFNVNKSAATKIFSALQKVRVNAKDANT